MSSMPKVTRWASEGQVSELAGFQTAITTPMTMEQIEAHVLCLRIQEITQKLNFNNILPANRSRRSVSPEPLYNAAGRRVNTRYQRYRERLEEERNSLIQVAIRTIPDYCAPAGLRLNTRPHVPIKDKVYIPTRDFPDINFIGQLLGPRGRSLADLNAQSGATIMIRGKGSVKEGRENRFARLGAASDQNEPLHCLITADTQQKVDKAKSLVNTIIETLVCSPQQAYERKSNQLRDLAVMNGTFRDDEGYSREEQKNNITSNVMCTICSSRGHVAPKKAGSFSQIHPWQRVNRRSAPGDAMDIEYNNFLAEIGQKF